MGNSENRGTRQERSWIMYDWANSVYATIIMAAIFPIYFASVAPAGDVWWGYGTSIATFTVAILAPFLGAIADYKGMKKKLFTAFLIIGVVFTALMAMTDNWKLLLVGYIFSYIGFTGSCLFYDSFLTDITTPARMDSVSAKGYAMGYIGGSTIPFIAAIVLNFVMEDAALAVKLSVVITSVWWALFSIPFLRDVKQTHSLGEIPKNFIGNVVKNVARTFMEIVKDKAVFLFMLAYFFYIDGVGTVIHMSTAYGSTLGLGTVGMILALLVTQLVAAPCAILFSKLAGKVGSIKMIGVAIGTYFLVCAVGFYMGFSLETAQQPVHEVFAETYTAQDKDVAEYMALFKDDCISALSSENRVEKLSELTAEYTTNVAQAVEKHPELAGEVISTINKISAKLLPIFTDTAFITEYSGSLNFSQALFWAMAVLVGTSQGGIQALSRSFFGKLIPPEKSNEYYGFFDIFGKFAAVMGPALYAFIKSITGYSSYGILGLMILFGIGGLMLILGRKYFRALESRSNERV